MADFNEHDINDLIRLSAAFTDALTNAALDPTAVTLKIRRRAKGVTTTTYTYGVDAGLVRDGVGLYHLDYTPTAAGDYYYRFTGTGAAQAAEEKFFRVRTSQVT